MSFFDGPDAADLIVGGLMALGLIVAILLDQGDERRWPIVERRRLD